MHHTPRHSRSGIHYSCTALSPFINETSQQWNFPGINLARMHWFSCATHVLRQIVFNLSNNLRCPSSTEVCVCPICCFVSGPPKESAWVGNNVCDPILEVWLVNCRAQIQVLQLNFIGCIHCKICLFTSIYL